jgi:tetratricopeptide (TPR) repeat protein
VENERALQSLGRALELNPDDVDARCCRGGALRRRALRDRERRKSDLEASLADYERALEKGRHNTYAGLNIVRLHFLMQPFRNDAGEIRDLHLRRMYHLCEFEVADALRTKASESWWSHFDLGDALVMHGRPDDGIGSYDAGIRLIPDAERRDVLLSPLRAWKELISADTLDGPVLRGAEEVSKLLDQSSG